MSVQFDKEGKVKNLLILLLGGVALGYGALPADLIPDVIPVAGAIDDVAIALAFGFIIGKWLLKKAPLDTKGESA